MSEYWTAEKAAKNFVNGVAVGVEKWGHIEDREAGLYGAATGFVYFITIGYPYPTHVKIGFTSKNPEARMANLQTGCPFKMKLLGYVFGNQAMESELHDVLGRWRCEGEWFEFSDYVSELVDAKLSEEYD